MDDTLLMGHPMVKEARSIKIILKLIMEAYGMQINQEKYKKNSLTPP